jgi:hypothetical protein
MSQPSQIADMSDILTGALGRYPNKMPGFNVSDYCSAILTKQMVPEDQRPGLRHHHGTTFVPKLHLSAAVEASP